jgi:glycosyltransferase involved in cell wall biosynthesis
MDIGINASAAFKEPKTGVEEYTHQLIKHLAISKKNSKHRFILYCGNVNDSYCHRLFPALPDNFNINKLKWSFFGWTQLRLSAEMAFKKPDLLFIPVHVLPLIHPENSVVTIHGLEYEYYPELYSRNRLAYLRFSTNYSLKHAKKIIAVSQTTKEDLIKLYEVDPEKIKVIYHGFSAPEKSFQFIKTEKDKISSSPYLLFLGRLETKKNTRGLIRAFDLLKEKYRLPHKLILAGPRGYGYKSVKNRINTSRHKEDIIEKGYVSREEKWRLLKNAELFLFPSFYEGFGLPILEAQSAGCPVITSNLSSMSEIAGKSAFLVNPERIEEITEAIYKIIKDQRHRENLTRKGYQNIKRFSWQKCADETLRALVE